MNQDKATQASSRRGAALVVLLVALGIVGILMGTIVVQSGAHRQQLDRREKQLQATWLARAGMEIAQEKIHNTGDYAGEKLELLPKSQVEIQVKKDKGAFLINVEARYPTDEPYPVVRSLNLLVANR